MKYCPYCNQMVSPVKRPSWFLFIFLSVITGGSWIFIYAIYYFLFKKRTMPYLRWKRFKEEIEYISPRNFYLLDFGAYYF